MTMLRDYQEDICRRVREAFVTHRSVMMQMPTGTGKTAVLASLVMEELKDERIKGGCAKVLIVAHRRELIRQIKETIKRMVVTPPPGEASMPPGEAPLPPGGGIVVESIQTISRRIGNPPTGGWGGYPTGGWGGFSLVIVDEAHHALAKTYKMMWDAWPEARFLGLTATPYRLSGEGFTDLFDVLVESWTVKRFIAEGWLAAFDYYSIRPESDDQKLIDNLKKRGVDGDFQMKEMHETLDIAPCIKRLFESFERFAYQKKGIVYAIDIAHAEHIAEYYRQQGVNALAISSKTPKRKRKEMIKRFRGAGGLCVLVSVDLFSEGFDCPDVEFIQLARPTLSLAKYLQMVGRGLRPHKGKENCIIIDNVGLYRRFGLPSGERDWRMFFEGNEKSGIRNEELRLSTERWRKWKDDFSEGSDLMKIVGHEGMVSRYANLGKAGFELRKKGNEWVWVDTLTDITFGKHPVVVDFKGVDMVTDDGVTFYPRIRSKWIDGKSGINRKTLETQVGDGFGWRRRYVSLSEPDKVYELQEVMDNGMRVYKDEEDNTFFQQDLDSPLVSEADAGGRKAFMTKCDEKLRDWEGRAKKRMREGFDPLPPGGGGSQSADIIYEHRPVVRYRGFVKLLYDGDMVYIMNIHEERLIAYHNWEIRADDGICTIGNKLYLRSDKDGKALWIRKRSSDFQMFVVNEPMEDDFRKNTLPYGSQIMIINKCGKEIEMTHIKESQP